MKTLSGGVDVVLDMVAGDYLPKNLTLLKHDGRCVVIAVQGGATATISAAFLMVNRLTLTGSTLRPQSIESKGRIAKGLREKVWPLLAAGTIKPIIYKTFPLAQAAQAHAELERADHVGKVDADDIGRKRGEAPSGRTARTSIMLVVVVVIVAGGRGVIVVHCIHSRCLVRRLRQRRPQPLSPSSWLHPRGRPSGGICPPRR